MAPGAALGHSHTVTKARRVAWLASVPALIAVAALVVIVDGQVDRKADALAMAECRGPLAEEWPLPAGALLNTTGVLVRELGDGALEVHGFATQQDVEGPPREFTCRVAPDPTDTLSGLRVEELTLLGKTPAP